MFLIKIKINCHEIVYLAPVNGGGYSIHSIRELLHPRQQAGAVQHHGALHVSTAIRSEDEASRVRSYNLWHARACSTYLSELALRRVNNRQRFEGGVEAPTGLLMTSSTHISIASNRCSTYNAVLSLQKSDDGLLLPLASDPGARASTIRGSVIRGAHGWGGPAWLDAQLGIGDGQQPWFRLSHHFVPVIHINTNEAQHSLKRLVDDLWYVILIYVETQIGHPPFKQP